LPAAGGADGPRRPPPGGERRPQHPRAAGRSVRRAPRGRVARAGASGVRGSDAAPAGGDQHRDERHPGDAGWGTPADPGRGGDGGGPAEAFWVRVTDEGPGIAPENLAHLFDPFFTTKPVGEGTGLGLAVVHAIVQEHGGRVTVANEPGGGASFTVFLPPGREEALLERLAS